MADGFDSSRWMIGAMYKVPWSPRPHRLEEIRKRHCQLHGDFIGYELCLRKQRNSEVRPWGSVSCASPDQDIRLISDSDAALRSPDKPGEE